MTKLLYLEDADAAYITTMNAKVIAVSSDAIELHQTIFYPTGGGQPHDTGTLTWEGGACAVTEVVKRGTSILHVVSGELPQVGSRVTGEIDWERRHQLMRAHTAAHVLSGVIWSQWEVPITGASMGIDGVRMDFAFDPLPENFASEVEQLVNAELERARQVNVVHMPRSTALNEDDLVRTKVSLIPEAIASIRVIDIVGLDRQADGGTHVRSTDEVGRVAVTKVQSKGRENKRVRMEVRDA